MLVTKTLPQDVAHLVFVPWNKALQLFDNPASTPRPSSHKDSHCGRKEPLPTWLSLMLFGPEQSFQLFDQSSFDG